MSHFFACWFHLCLYYCIIFCTLVILLILGWLPLVLIMYPIQRVHFHHFIILLSLSCLHISVVLYEVSNDWCAFIECTRLFRIFVLVLLFLDVIRLIPLSFLLCHLCTMLTPHKPISQTNKPISTPITHKLLIYCLSFEQDLFQLGLFVF